MQPAPGPESLIVIMFGERRRRNGAGRCSAQFALELALD
jgi:hypothetical protein